MLRLRSFAAVLVLSVMVTQAAASARVHFSVVRSAPAAGQSLATPPAKLQIWFSQTPAALVSQLSLVLDKTPVALGKTVIEAKDKTMYAVPDKPLAPGAYTMTWKAAGDDGHVLTGDVKFTIAKP